MVRLSISTLSQFFVILLIKKAEGYGPMKPWQPGHFIEVLNGANSILISAGRDEADHVLVEVELSKILTHLAGEFFCSRL